MKQPSAISSEHSADSFAESVEKDGFAIVPNFLDEHSLKQLDRLFCNSGYGERNLLNIAEIRELAISESVRSLVSAVIGKECFAVRGILFDKTDDANWAVPWHQDRVIAVETRFDVDGFKLWSLKAGVHHVQPPAEVVSGMVAIRLHLDDCDESNGALRVIPRSHKAGLIGDRQLIEWDKKTHVVCAVRKGDAILMRPLLLHSSLHCENPRRRRVIHLEFASSDLSGGLQWRDRVQ